MPLLGTIKEATEKSVARALAQGRISREMPDRRLGPSDSAEVARRRTLVRLSCLETSRRDLSREQGTAKSPATKSPATGSTVAPLELEPARKARYLKLNVSSQGCECAGRDHSRPKNEPAANTAFS